MKQILVSLAILGTCLTVGGCSEAEAPSNDVNAKIKAMPAEERFKLIRDNTGMGPMQKSMAIDNIESASAEQKAKWKQELSLPELGSNSRK
jgi:hypothetical protein